MAQVHYAPLHLMPYYKKLGKPGRETCRWRRSITVIVWSLPMFPALTDEEQDYVIEKVLEFIERV